MARQAWGSERVIKLVGRRSLPSSSSRAASSCREDRVAPCCSASFSGFHEFDEALCAIRRWCEEKIYARSVRARTRCGVDGREPEFHTQNLSGPIDIGYVHFDLLNSLAKFLKIPGNSARSCRIACGQNIEIIACTEMQFEFESVLVRRDIGETG